MYKGLYLAVPGIPFAIENLNQLGSRLENIIFIFGWNLQDNYKFKWDYSFEEKKKYDNIMNFLQEYYYINYTSYMFDNGSLLDNENEYHELNPNMIKHIVDNLENTFIIV